VVARRYAVSGTALSLIGADSPSYGARHYFAGQDHHQERRLPDGSVLSLIDGVKVRIIAATVTVTCHDGTSYGDSYRLATTMLDHRAYPGQPIFQAGHAGSIPVARPHHNCPVQWHSAPLLSALLRCVLGTSSPLRADGFGVLPDLPVLVFLASARSLPCPLRGDWEPEASDASPHEGPRGQGQARASRSELRSCRQ